ncbi:MAG: hypothetical protein NTV93_21025 [Verrucomicrobia bacterium]|nr:hypothetical protein [Verrucomicrobiota bacterium]
MKMNTTTIAALTVTCLMTIPVIGADNLVKNPDLSADTTGWQTSCFTATGEEAKRDKGADFISHVATDGAGGSKGCIKITTKLEEGGGKTPHNTGGWALIEKVPGSPETPCHLKVLFYAKSGDGTTGYLYVGRVNGGGNKHILPISSEWQKFEVEISAPYPTSGIIFCPTDKKGKDAIDGEVLLDEVTVEDLGPADH